MAGDGVGIPLEHVAKLARLELSPAELETFQRQLGDVLSHVAKLNEVDTSGVQPLAHARPLANVWREDVPSASLSRDDAVDLAPVSSNGMIQVPRVVGES